MPKYRIREYRHGDLYCYTVDAAYIELEGKPFWVRMWSTYSTLADAEAAVDRYIEHDNEITWNRVVKEYG